MKMEIKTGNTVYCSMRYFFYFEVNNYSGGGKFNINENPVCQLWIKLRLRVCQKCRTKIAQAGKCSKKVTIKISWIFQGRVIQDFRPQ